jgi:hypothetical protein
VATGDPAARGTDDGSELCCSNASYASAPCHVTVGAAAGPKRFVASRIVAIASSIVRGHSNAMPLQC